MYYHYKCPVIIKSRTDCSKIKKGSSEVDLATTQEFLKDFMKRHD